MCIGNSVADECMCNHVISVSYLPFPAEKILLRLGEKRRAPRSEEVPYKEPWVLVLLWCKTSEYRTHSFTTSQLHISYHNITCELCNLYSWIEKRVMESGFPFSSEFSPFFPNKVCYFVRSIGSSCKHIFWRPKGTNPVGYDCDPEHISWNSILLLSVELTLM